MATRAPKPSAPPPRPSSGAEGAELSRPARPSAGSYARAFLAQLAGVDDNPEDPHRAAKWAAGLVMLGVTGLFVWRVVREHKAAHRAGYREARARYAPARDTRKRRG